jgi:membrane dipeptidase
MVRPRAFLPLVALLSTSALAAPSPEQVAAAALKAAPVWDGHNDVPEQLRERRKDMIGTFDFRDTTDTADPAHGLIAMQTDLARLRKGHVGAQFWSVFVSTALSEPQAVQATIEQIDVLKRLIARYPQDLVLCTTADEVERAMKAGTIASLTWLKSTSMPIRCISRTTSRPKSVRPSWAGASVALSDHGVFLKCASVM